MDDLQVIDPAPVPMWFRGELLELLPLRIGELPKFSRLVRPVVAEFARGRHPQWEANDDLMIAEMAELHGEKIIEAAAIAVRKPEEWIAGGTDMKELVGLIRGIVEVNRDFFIHAVKASWLVPGHAPTPPSAAGAGQTAFSASSAPATH